MNEKILGGNLNAALLGDGLRAAESSNRLYESPSNLATPV
jgi:hypothetical protein